MKGAEPTGDCEEGGSRRKQMNPEEATAYFKYMTEVRVPKMSVDELLDLAAFCRIVLQRRKREAENAREITAATPEEQACGSSMLQTSNAIPQQRGNTEFSQEQNQDDHAQPAPSSI